MKTSNRVKQIKTVVQNAKKSTIAPEQASILKRLYGEMKAHDFLLQSMYLVKIENVYNLQGDIPWFRDKSLCYLVTDANFSFGSAEAETFYAGAMPAGCLTQQTGDDIDITFIETLRGDIFKSFRACYKLAFNDDGTVNEPRKYAFKLSMALIDHKNTKRNSIAPVGMSWIVSVKAGQTEVSATGRSEVVKENITFQKIRPLLFAQ